MTEEQWLAAWIVSETAGALGEGCRPLVRTVRIPVTCRKKQPIIRHNGRERVTAAFASGLHLALFAALEWVTKHGKPSPASWDH